MQSVKEIHGSFEVLSNARPHHKPAGYWKDIKNQRYFFDQLAVKLNVRNPEEWVSIPSKKIFEEGGSFISKYYGSSISQGV
jgi:hypothetical protein